jgi:hypothetical protein
LLNLPDEVLLVLMLEIAPDYRCLARFSRTCRRLAGLLEPAWHEWAKSMGLPAPDWNQCYATVVQRYVGQGTITVPPDVFYPLSVIKNALGFWRKDGTAARTTVRRNGHAVRALTDKERTPEVCLEVVKQDGDAVQYLMSDERTPEICLEAVKQNGNAVRHLTDEERTLQVCLEAVKQNGNAVRHLTDEQRTLQVCLAAVEQNAYAVFHLTAAQRTHGVQCAVFKQCDRRGNGAARHFTDGQRAFWREHGHMFMHEHAKIQFLTDSQRSTDVCLAAIMHNGPSVRYL